ncbi:MAG TPA: TonB-dependent receptor, partial [Campylobacterales bacterium]|nr:TonB-dependent receptor [Campylobacterales bacterium]
RQEDSIGANIFYLENKNQINKINSDNQFRNSSDSRIAGAEIEYKNKFDFGGFLYLGYSYIGGTTSSENSLPAAASHMLKGAFTSKLGSGFSIGTSAIYVGSKKRVAGDTRDDTPSYTTADLVLNYDTKGWGVQTGVKNIADATILYPSEQRTYSGDYPIGKRFFFVKLYGRF